MKNEMLSSLQHRFKDISELTIATILDPQSKDKFFPKAETKKLQGSFSLTIVLIALNPPEKASF